MEPAMTSPPYTAAPSDPSAWNPIPTKRWNSPTAQDPAKKPKQNISDEIIPDSVIFPRISDDLSSLHLTREDLKLSLEDRMKKIVRGCKEEMDEDDSTDEIDEPEYGPEDTLPKGYDWASFCYGTGDKNFIVKMDCFICGVGLDHWPVDCPKKRVLMKMAKKGGLPNEIEYDEGYAWASYVSGSEGPYVVGIYTVTKFGCFFLK